MKLLYIFNKGACRGCGVYLTPISVCTICKEYISWIYGKCERMDDVSLIPILSAEFHTK
jgi:hypothetical protein